MTWGRDTDEHEAEDQLRALCRGWRHLVDTAAAYGDGASGVPGSLADVFPRDEIIVATKAGVTGADDAPDTSRRALLTTLDASLDRLGTDHVDLWQVHLWSDATPIEEVLSTLDHAVSSGRARYVGVLQLGLGADRGGQRRSSSPGRDACHWSPRRSSIR